MHIVAINGSPRPDGNTNALVQAICNGAREAGAEASCLQLGRMTIAGCVACQRCKKSHRCVVNDNMQRFYDLAPKADLLVLASPIYLDHITAQLMTFIQRLYCYIGPSMENFYPRRARAVLGITFGYTKTDAYDDVLEWMAGRLDYYFKIPTLERFRIAGTAHKHPVGPDHPELRRAAAFSRSLT